MTNGLALGIGGLIATLLSAGLLGVRLSTVRARARRLETEIRARDQRLQTFIESCRGFALLFLDPEGRVVDWNDGATSVHGWEKRDIVGRDFTHFHTPEDIAEGRPAQALKIAASNGRFAEQGWRVRRDGSRYWADVIITALKGEDGTVTGFAYTTADGTDRARAEKEQLDLLRSVQASVEARDHFLSVAAHELRTPLTSLQLQVQSLMRGARKEAERRSDDAFHRRLESIDRHVMRFASLIEQLLDVSKITSGKLELHPEPVDLATVVRDTGMRFEADLAKAGCTLTVRGPDRIAGEWDRFRVEQVVSNLISNAIKYGAGKPVEIDVEDAQGVARLRVRDHGIGIAPEDQQRIFQRFERAVSELHYGGLGLGLWIVRQTVEAQGGRIAVESAPGQGATFTVELPKNEQPARFAQG